MFIVFLIAGIPVIAIILFALYKLYFIIADKFSDNPENIDTSNRFDLFDSCGTCTYQSSVRLNNSEFSNELVDPLPLYSPPVINTHPQNQTPDIELNSIQTRK